MLNDDHQGKLRKTIEDTVKGQLFRLRQQAESYLREVSDSAKEHVKLLSFDLTHELRSDRLERLVVTHALALKTSFKGEDPRWEQAYLAAARGVAAAEGLSEMDNSVKAAEVAVAFCETFANRTVALLDQRAAERGKAK